MIQTGFHTSCVSYLKLADAFRLIKDLGFTYVDVNAAAIGEDAHVDQMHIVDQPERMAEQIREQAGLHGLKLQELFICPVFVEGARVEVNNPDRMLRTKLLQNFEQICVYAAKAGFKSVMGVPGTLLPEADEKESWRLSADMLNRMLERCVKYDLAFHVEPHVGSIIIEPEKAIRLAGDVPGLAYTLDYSHFISQGIPQREVDVLLAYTGHMHARQAAIGEMACPVEQGVIDFEDVIGRLKEREWDGIISMEYRGASKDILSLTSIFQNIVLAYQLEKLYL